MLFPQIPIAAAFRAIKPYGYIAIWLKYGSMAIQPYGHMAVRVANTGVYGKSNKNVAIWSRN